MIKIENIEVWGFEHAIRGMRNPMNSWGRSDSGYGIDGEDDNVFVIGVADMKLMRKLYRAGSEHRKYLRQIFCSFDANAPLYWWKEFETYKVGTVSNSCSTMHKIDAKKFTLDDFSHEHLNKAEQNLLEDVIEMLNVDRELYRTDRTKMKKEYWWQMIQLLPSSYNQRRTITMNYENVMSIINQRTGHKLDEWHDLIAELRKLPYVNEIRGEDDVD